LLFKLKLINFLIKLNKKQIDYVCSKLFHIRDQLTEQYLPTLRILQERYYRLHPKICVPPLIDAIHKQPEELDFWL